MTLRHPDAVLPIAWTTRHSIGEGADVLQENAHIPAIAGSPMTIVHRKRRNSSLWQHMDAGKPDTRTTNWNQSTRLCAQEAQPGQRLPKEGLHGTACKMPFGKHKTAPADCVCLSRDLLLLGCYSGRSAACEAPACCS